MPVDNEIIKQSINEVLKHYAEGWDVFKNAKSWEHPVNIRLGSESVEGLPTTWMDLAEKVIGIIAKEKYGLDCYDNMIEMIGTEEMLDNYASAGLPINYEHWSFGVEREQLEKQFRAGSMGLAYEIVINSDPVIAYNMDSNSPLMQLLVIAHASFGHNSFFKGNHMFKEHTQAKTIMSDLRDMRDYIHACEAKYGFKEVELLLDSCHALKSQGVDRSKHTINKQTNKGKAQSDANKKTEVFGSEFDNKIFSGIRSKKEFESTKAPDPREPIAIDHEENLLTFIADHSPELPDWKRNVMRMVAKQAQYFYPQMQTKVMNEGWASFWHYTLMHDMADLDLIDDGMVLELEHSQSSVLMQPAYDSPYFNGQFNPYALGFAMFTDIKRMCEQPTEEDQQYFPYVVGNEDWLGVLKSAMEDFKDESFIEQYLSPKVMRDFDMFAVRDDNLKDYQEVSAIHETNGYDHIRVALAAEYRTENMQPVLEVCQYNQSTDRALTIEHRLFNGRPLHDDEMEAIMKHLHVLWGHPVIIDSINTHDGRLYDRFTCPEDYRGP